MDDLISRQAVYNVLDKMPVRGFRKEGETIHGLISLSQVNSAIINLPSAQPEPHWIPCSERLPELDVYVIATTQWHEITMACRIGDGEWFINEGGSNAYDDDVIAWMPLPEPYQEGADE